MKKPALFHRTTALSTVFVLSVSALLGVGASAYADEIPGGEPSAPTVPVEPTTPPVPVESTDPPAPVAPLAAPAVALQLEATTLPSITGQLKNGSTLSANPGVWNDTGIAYSYQWLANGTAINRATKVTYGLLAADAGKKISVKVTGTKTGATTGTATSLETTPVIGLASGPNTAFFTFYGWWDNTPPGGDISYPGLHQTAGGTGTFADPISFATSNKALAPGTKIFVPRVAKYFIMEDSCQECGVDFTGQGPNNSEPGPNGGPGLIHIDLWLGGQGGSAFDAIDCEDALTHYNEDSTPVLESVIIAPGPDEVVDPTPIFDTATGECYGGAEANSTVGQYKNTGTGTCLTSPGNSALPGTALTAEECNNSVSQSFTFRGAFLMINGQCAQMDTTGSPRLIRLHECDGGPDQQWSINPDLTITDIQYGRYSIAASGGAIIANAFKDNPQPMDKWNFTADADEATVTLSTSTVTAGGDIHVHATGLKAEDVQIWLHSDPVLLKTVTVGADGVLDITVTIPANTTVGDHELLVVGLSSGIAGLAEIAVTAVTTTALAVTGASVPWLIPTGAITLLLAGGLLLVLAKRRKKA